MKKILLALLLFIGMTISLSADISTFEEAKKACDNGNMNSCVHLGYCYEFGKGVDINASIARKLYKKACDNKNPWGCERLGHIYKHGYDIKKDTEQAEHYFDKALQYFTVSCNKNDMEACVSIGHLYAKGDGVKYNLPKAKSFYAKASIGNSVYGAHYLSKICTDTNLCTLEENEISINYVQKICNEENKYYCDALAKLYIENKGKDQDYKKAIAYYQSQYDNEDSLAPGELSSFYEKDIASEEDYKQALAFYHKKCNEKTKEEYPDPCYDEAKLYYLGKLGLPALKNRLNKLKDECHNNVLTSCQNLGDYYETDYYYDENMTLSLKYYNIGCNKGNSHGCLRSANLYKDGKKVEKDIFKAIEFYSKACSLKNKYGCEMYDKLSN